MIDLARLLPILDAMPRRGLYAGTLRYTSLNETTLSGGKLKRVEWLCSYDSHSSYIPLA